MGQGGRPRGGHRGRPRDSPARARRRHPLQPWLQVGASCSQQLLSARRHIRQLKIEALKVAMETKTASENALKAAEVELASFEAKHVELLTVCNAAGEKSAASEAVVATKEGRLADVKSAFSTFTELVEQQSNAPEPGNDATMEDKLEAAQETT